MRSSPLPLHNTRWRLPLIGALITLLLFGSALWGTSWVLTRLAQFAAGLGEPQGTALQMAVSSAREPATGAATPAAGLASPDLPDATRTWLRELETLLADDPAALAEVRRLMAEPDPMRRGENLRLLQDTFGMP